MAGMIFCRDGGDWSASSSVFYWLLDTLAEHAQDGDLAARLRCISENNLGSINLAELAPAELDEFVSLAARAPQFARDELPDTPHRDAVVDHIVEFAETVAADRGRAGTPTTTEVVE